MIGDSDSDANNASVNSQSTSSAEAAAVQNATDEAARAAKAATLEVVRRQAYDGCRNQSGQCRYVSIIFSIQRNFLVLMTNDISTQGMKVPVDSDDTRELRVISLNTVFE